MTKPLNKRQNAKAATRQKVIDGAKALWAEPGSYKEKGGAGIREIAAHIKMSTGAVFANFETKDDLWRAAFECEPPIDSVLTRAAPELFQALQDLVDIRPEVSKGDDAFAAQTWRIAEALLERVKDQLLEEQRKAEAKTPQPPAVTPSAVELAAA